MGKNRLIFLTRMLSRLRYSHFKKTLRVFSSSVSQKNLVFDNFLFKDFSSDIDNYLIKQFPQKYDKSLETFSEGLLPKDQESINDVYFNPANFLLKNGGKRWRPYLLYLYGNMQGPKRISRDQIFTIAALGETLHNATLIVDDVQDGSLKRRGNNCVHIEYGIDKALAAALGLFYGPVVNIQNLKYFTEDQKHQILAIYNEEVNNLIYGISLDISWHNENYQDIPSERSYIEMIKGKTAVLPRMMLRMAQYVAFGKDIPETEKSIIKYIYEAGKSFQIKDDIINIDSLEFAKGKGSIGEDITEGKITLMAIHLQNNCKNDQVKQRFFEILRSKTYDSQEILEAAKILKNAGSIEYAEQRCKEYNTLAQDHLKEQLEMSFSDPRITNSQLEQITLCYTNIKNLTDYLSINRKV